MTLNECFKYIYYINLDRRIDRRQCIERTLKTCNIEAIRVAGNEDINGHRGCTLSHCKIIQNAKDTNLERIFIFEDDATYIPRTLEYLEKALDELQTVQWDLFYTYSEPSIAITEHLQIQKAWMYTHAYGINYIAYDKLLKNLDSDQPTPIDTQIVTMCLQNKLKLITTKIPIFYQRQSYSDTAYCINGGKP